jgi:pyrimidine deaminase RibD-like protein
MMNDPSDGNTDRAFMEVALEEARLSVSEDGQVRPFVGAIAVRDGEILGSAHRGESAPGDHAEFVLLEKKLADVTLAGSTVFTTLEPCTTRNHPKVPCADRLVERGVRRVVVGMLDPDSRIRGIGVERLRNAGISVALAEETMPRVEELNREYRRLKQSDERVAADPQWTETARTRRLDDWYRAVNVLYWSKNAARPPAEILTHLVEVVGGVSGLASSKQKPGINPGKHLAKAIAWWMSLCGSEAVRSVEEMIWAKFPRACPYCLESPHNNDLCTEIKRQQVGPQWIELGRLGRERTPPGRLGEWQGMFATIYPIQQGEGFGPAFARLAEELGELAEAVRVFRHQPGYFLSEAADVFAWLMRIRNLLDVAEGASYRDRGAALEMVFATSYPDACIDCGNRRCSCPDVLPTTVGRIAHEDPAVGDINDERRFMTADQRRHAFSPN